LGQRLVPDYDGVVDLVLDRKRFHRLPSVVIHGNANDRKSFGLVLLLEFHVPGNFSLAAVAPGSPEIKQDDSAFVIGQSDGSTLSVAEGKVWRRLTQIGRRSSIGGHGCGIK